jgi:Glycosyltransferase
MKSEVVFFMPDFASGGAERVTIRIFNELIKQSVDATMVVINKNGQLINCVEFPERIVCLDCSRLVLSYAKLLKYFKSKKNAVVFSIMTQPSLLALFIMRINHLPISINVVEHSNLAGMFSKSIRKHKMANMIKYSLYKMLMKWLYKYSSSIITVSKEMSADIKRIIGEEVKIKTIYNPIVCDEIFDNAQTGNVIKEYGQCNTKKLLFAGRLEREKNLSFLLDVFASVLSKYRNGCKLFLLGTGSELDTLKNVTLSLGLQNDVFFIGYEKNPYPYIMNADLVVLTSTVEGFPSVLVESLAFGVPIISSNCKTGPNEIILDEHIGSLCRLGDKENFVNAIISWLSLNDSYSEYRKQYAMQYSLENSVREYKNIIDSVF